MKRTRTLPVAVALLCLAPLCQAGEHAGSLKNAFGNDFLVGAAVNREQIMGRDPRAMELVARQFNTLTAENVMKWEKIEPSEGRFDWEAADALVEFAESHGMEVAGHVLVWHQQTPGWVFEAGNGEPANREQLIARMKNHIDAVVGRYRGRVQSWEVVNEALNEDGSLRQTPWLDIIGADYIDLAFEFAHAADPQAKLYYNDYNLFKPEKAAGARKLITGLMDKGIPVHGAGMQGHYGLDNPKSMHSFNDAIRGFGQLGLEVYITELDVSVLPFPPQSDWGADIGIDLELNEQYNPYPHGLPAGVAEQQARQYTMLFEALVANRQYVSRVTFWGVNDGHSWKNDWPMRGRTDYPLLFDRENRAKPVFHRVIEQAGAGRETEE